ncbi:MAG: hypothetical protein ACJAU0_000369 [Flavobacteriales bacterium]|jgi:hypothetical protein
MSSSWTSSQIKAGHSAKISKVHIRAFRACDDVNSSQRFVDGHLAVLANHGFKKLASSSDTWIESKDVYVILVTSPSGHKIYGGARIHVRQIGEKLPLENAIMKFDDRVSSVVEEMIPQGCAELCALWNSVEVAGFGIGSKLVIRCAISMCETLNITHLLALSSPPTRRWMKGFGFTTITEIGHNGGFPYPTEKLIATVAHYISVGNVDNMDPDFRTEVEELRKNPKKVGVSSGPKGEISLHYDLLVKQ